MVARRARWSLGIATATAAAMAAILAKTPSEDEPVLARSQTLHAVLQRGEQRRYSIPLAHRDCAFATLRPWAGAKPITAPAQKLELRVYDTQAASPLRRFEMNREALQFGFCVEPAGSYNLVVSSPAQAGGYELCLDAVLPRATASSKLMPEPELDQAPEPAPMSPRLRELSAQLRADPSYLERFWQEATRDGTPLIEPVDADTSWVTFLVRSSEATRAVSVSWPMWTFRFARTQLARLPGTDLWWKSVTLPNAARFSYQLTIDPPQVSQADSSLRERAEAAVTRADPHNPHRMTPDPTLDAYAVRSVAQLPAAPPEPWLVPKPGTARGGMQQHNLHSRALGHDHTLSVYLPPGYDRSHTSALLIFFDGESYLHDIPTPRLLDRLTAAKAITPLVAVFVHNDVPNQRAQELPCNPAFAAFVADELLPFMRQHYNISRESAHVGLAGSSFGGLASSYIALQYPGRFGKVLSQSGSYWWSFPADNPAFDGSALPGWLIRRYAEHPVVSIQFYLGAGTFEASPNADGVLEQNRLLRDTLRELEYSVAYQEYVGGHDYLAWRATLPEALVALFATQPETE